MFRNLSLPIFILLCLKGYSQKDYQLYMSTRLSVYSPIGTPLITGGNYSLHGMGIGINQTYEYFIKKTQIGLSLAGGYMRSEVPAPYLYNVSSVPQSIIANPSGALNCLNLMLEVYRRFGESDSKIFFQPSFAYGVNYALLTELPEGVRTPTQRLFGGQTALNDFVKVGVDFAIPVNDEVKILIGFDLYITQFRFQPFRITGVSEIYNYYNAGIHFGYQHAINY
ncbi:hypothetical protein [Croceimicrobium hydrocarbonivorans]|uniref:Outer membrane protein beta-barrel domain-containing protein n=1 Tax=Croceimicrobium hydrocarbonivorans TaxID=2761580 RepID=A0A7H0VC82_9FLAO|nr:hypothetical protein [Croceimicrobium hydrocarbonivorans]QNR23330.1 hypothetical protein H4K34_13210 [Croceimicrobium hydrocarbonivorans]